MKTLAKLPVTIVTGFLGSGKTTLLRHMLDNAQGRRIAVIVNEFGELGIDGEILKQCSIGCTEEEASGRVYELANGCLCCTVQEEFFPVMRELVARRGDLDHILIETSGLALPKPLVQAFQWPEIRSACTVDAVITVVDSPAVAAGTFAAFPDQVDAQRKLDPNLDHELAAHSELAVVMGDLNVGHRKLDIKNWKGNVKRAGFLPEERAYFDKILGAEDEADYNAGAGLGWVDVGRRFAGEVEGPYTWWSWRGQAFDNDTGWRIDYQLATPALAATVTHYTVDRANAYDERWSDHAPVVVDYAI